MFAIHSLTHTQQNSAHAQAELVPLAHYSRHWSPALFLATVAVCTWLDSCPRPHTPTHFLPHCHCLIDSLAALRSRARLVCDRPLCGSVLLLSSRPRSRRNSHALH
ncbi:hypothetical protein MPTK1_5g13360 [Marchantia polymorpha subsp. ruderalis]|uniref:Uncharacterized protein n=2 Tax=Marchantia polymorpha TaxID=3197 RepID=A0AAF6BHX6_MARPO|nr:hypothetical protein MARPO_0032s0029 [Marchantia polymorpha]BBN11610.1 hypothetical protein Mp_5g13360 [Marchantia polymorpha subsp. ruderalis]|eukprot:PTQ41824.1 hypothetical protein MARPO_0032s0029 [Marchantia polymorpha]